MLNDSGAIIFQISETLLQNLNQQNTKRDSDHLFVEMLDGLNPPENAWGRTTDIGQDLVRNRTSRLNLTTF